MQIEAVNWARVKALANALAKELSGWAPEQVDQTFILSRGEWSDLCDELKTLAAKADAAALEQHDAERRISGQAKELEKLLDRRQLWGLDTMWIIPPDKK